jgi:hypothetical protein
MTTILDEVNKFITSRLEEAEELRTKLLAERKVHVDKIAEIDGMLTKLPGAKKPAKNGGGKKLSPLAQTILAAIKQRDFVGQAPVLREEIIQTIDPKASNKKKGEIWLAIKELENGNLIQEDESKRLLIVGP